jgi:hypothetical protein
MDANSSRSTFKSGAADIFKAFTKRITNDDIYISFVENNSVGIEMVSILKIIFNLKSGSQSEVLTRPFRPGKIKIDHGGERQAIGNANIEPCQIVVYSFSQED